jgi:glutamate dehydrogenase
MLDDKARQWLKSEVDNVAESRLSGPQLRLFSSFSEHFIHIHLNESLLSWRAADLFDALYCLYDYFQQRDDASARIRVFNPSLEEDGWRSSHTVIYISQRDMPFLKDSLQIALNRLGLNVYLFESLTAWVKRDNEGNLECISRQVPASESAQYTRENIALLQIDAQGDAGELETIRQDLLSVLADVDACVSDYQPMLERLAAVTEEMRAQPAVDTEDIAFLEWLHSGNFTLLGYSEFQLGREDESAVLQELSDRRLGLMRQRDPLVPARLDQLSPGFAAFYASSATLGFTKAARRSTVHRAVYCDYVLIKRRDSAGEPIGEIRLLGLYTSKLYHSSIWDIPLIRKKAARLVELSQLEPSGHDGKAFAAVLEDHPRDELIQTELDQMFTISLGIWRIIERRAVRLILRIDPFEKFASAIVYLPRESLSTDNRIRIEQKLREALGAEKGEFSIQFLSDSLLVRIHFIFRITNRQYQNVDSAMLEKQVFDLTRDWTTALKEKIGDQWPPVQAPAIARNWAGAFEPAYQHEYNVEECIEDIACVTDLSTSEELGLRFFKQAGSSDDIMCLKLFQLEKSLELSDMIPMLENLGFRVLGEQPHNIELLDGKKVYMQHFSLRFTMDIQGALDVGAVREHFKQAFLAVWRGHTEDDAFNRLVLGARLDWRSAALLRTYANFLKQLGSPFRLTFISDVLSRHLDITRNMLALFRFKFDPRLYSTSTASEAENHAHRADRVQRLAEKIIGELDAVANRNDDELIRQYLQLLMATLRTNFFKHDNDETSLEYISLKMATAKLDFAPRPRPMFEIYVHSPRFEGVHLRGGKVARGGIRWSDRLEDYRTEILGLVKAQQVKNAVIVPTGAKGGFIARQADPAAGRDAWLQEGIASYRLFIGALLDITDNRIEGAICRPTNVVCVDDEDPYLVVAADKGTASFSDTANEVSADYGHWLGDAFASGGSNGYDHKAMGITARGAWVAVQRHFRELGVNIQEDSIDVIGIGDMSGDVFGNGMLLSEKIRLVAAFNHQHIFVDPSPNPARSFAERRRLFALSRSAWTDYEAELISQGGGIFERTAKTIPLSPQMQQLLDCQDSTLAPDVIINKLLKAPVDLIWNGGVGTYVKGANESDTQVGDRANDSVRVTGSELRCRVLGEGGNLGFTQLGRIEYCHGGGISNTDFIDNAAGVDCSDNEVNIKILLDSLTAVGVLSTEQRNETLRGMTDDIAELVLQSNYRQTLAISLARQDRLEMQHEYQRFMQFLEDSGSLDRQLEYLPDDEQLKELASKERAWTRPELSVLISYAKVWLKDALIYEGQHTDEYVLRYLSRSFPQQLNTMAPDAILQHQLANEIIATRIANDLVNRMGFTYCHRLVSSLGVSPMQVAKTFIVVMHLFDLDTLWSDIESLDYVIAAEEQHELLSQIMDLSRRASRWYIRNRRSFDPAAEIERTQKCFKALTVAALDLHQPSWRALSEQTANELVRKGIPTDLAARCAVLDSLFFFPGTIDVALETGIDVCEVTRLYFSLTSNLQVDMLMNALLEWQSKDRWQDLARESHIDELEHLLRQLTLKLLQGQESSSTDVTALEQHWRASQAAPLQRFEELMISVGGAVITDLAVVTVVLDELKNLVESAWAAHE